VFICVHRVFQRAAVFTAALSLVAQQLPMEKRAVELVRRIPVARLEAGLPRQTLVQWLTLAAGPNAKIIWEVTDCGEQTGNPDTDRGRDFPLCVDAVAALPGGRVAVVSVVMGSSRKGIAGPSKLRSVSIGRGNRFDPVPKLRDLPARIKAVN
jgi:hypothetical protein